MKRALPLKPGLLYLVATPIGNLSDFGERAVQVLKHVDLIACEDTRHSRPLLDHYGIDRPLFALHEHNEDKLSTQLIERLERGESIALISDAGTPLINDPGYPLVRTAHETGIRVVPIPGPCALIAALCASGLPTHRFAFEGFPPRKTIARCGFFEALLSERRTLIFYEASHRIENTLGDMATVFPASRRILIAREITKRYETIVLTTMGEALGLVLANAEMQLGEFVLVLEGDTSLTSSFEMTPDQRHVLKTLLDELTLKTAVKLTSKLTGVRRETVYKVALDLAEGPPT